MKLYFMKKEALDILKSNLDMVYKLDIIGSNDISSKISDIFYSNNFSANPVILSGIVKAFKNFKDENTQLSFKEHIRPSLCMEVYRVRS